MVKVVPAGVAVIARVGQVKTAVVNHRILQTTRAIGYQSVTIGSQVRNVISTMDSEVAVQSAASSPNEAAHDPG